MIRMTGFDQDYILHNSQNGEPVAMGEIFLSNGEELKLEGGRAPHKPGSTGRIWVRGASNVQREFFPSVLDLEWVPVSNCK